jgi:predicted PurR-regulated permease PerM
MNDSLSLPTRRAFAANALEAAVRIGLVALLAAWCLMIVRPFVEPVTWAIIIAVAVYPLYLHLAKSLRGRTKLAATVFTLLALAILITPTVMLSVSLVDSAHTLSGELQEGGLEVPPPPDSVAAWPVVGERLHEFWSLASQNLEAALNRIRPQLEATGKWLLAGAAGAGGGVLKFVLSIIIAGVLLANAKSGGNAARMIAQRIAGERGEEFATLASATVRSVAQGVLGVAAIQGFLAGVGLLAMGVPGAGLWAMLVLLLAVVQLPPLLILGPVIVYVFNVADTLPAVLFMIWALMVSMSDAFLKPMLLGRGLETPMLVILLGAIGGMVMSGIIGLFIGSVILAVGYELFMAWLREAPAQDSAQDSAQDPVQDPHHG